MSSLLILLLIWATAIPAAVIGGLLLAASWRERHPAAPDADAVPLLAPTPAALPVVRAASVGRGFATARPSRDTGCEVARPRSASR